MDWLPADLLARIVAFVRAARQHHTPSLDHGRVMSLTISDLVRGDDR